MEIKTHVLTNTQHLDAGRQQTARGNIGAASQDDLTALGQVVDGKVDKEEGKGLSTNDFTNEEKSNLDDAFNDRHTHENKDLLDGIDSYVSGAEKSQDGKTLTIHQTTGDIDFTGETNVIESISQNGTPLEIVNKNVEITETIQSISVNGTPQTITDHNVDIHVDTPISPYDNNPAMDGTATPGQSSAYARGDHAHPSDTTKADKVSEATSGNFAGLDSNGNLTDSGSKAADFATAAQGELADTAYQKPVDGIPKSDLDSSVQASLGKADTALQEHQDISGKADMVASAVSGNFAGLDSNGNLTDSGKKASDFASASAVQSVKMKDSSGNELNNGANVIIPEASTSSPGVMSVDDKSKLNGIAPEANKYIHPSYTAQNSGMYKVTIDAQGHVSSVAAIEKSDITALGIPSQDTTYNFADDYNGTTNKGATEATVRNAVSNAINALDKTENSTGGTNIEIQIVEENGLIKEIKVVTDNTVNTTVVNTAIETALANYGGFKVVSLTSDTPPVPDVQNPSEKYIYLTKDSQSTARDPYTEWIYIKGESSANPPTQSHWEVIGETSVDLSNYIQKVNGATENNFAAFTSDGAIKDSGKNASSFATAAQGTKADNSVQTVSINNGTAIHPTNGNVNIPLASPSAAAHDDVPAVNGNPGAMSAADKAKLDGINNYIESVTVAGRTMTLTPKSGPAVTFNDTGDINVIEKISVNGTQQTVTDKEVDLTIPAAANNAKITLKVNGAAGGDTTPVAGDFTVDQSLDKDIAIPAAVSASGNDPAKPGVMSSADKAKLDGIANGAEVNSIERITIEGDQNPLPISSENVTIPKAAYTTGVDPSYISGAVTGQDKKKLDEIEAGAQVNDIEHIKIAGESSDLTIDANKRIELPLAASATISPVAPATPGIMSAPDKDKLDHIAPNADENTIETISIDGGETLPIDEYKNVNIPLASPSAPAHDEVSAVAGNPGAMSANDKAKLNSIEQGAQVNVKPDWNAESGDPNEILNKPSLIGRTHFLKAVSDHLADVRAPYSFWVVDLEKPNAQSPYGYDYAMASEIIAKLSVGEVFVLSTYNSSPSSNEDMFFMSQSYDQSSEGHTAVRIDFTRMYASSPENMYYTSIYTPSKYNGGSDIDDEPEERLAIFNPRGQQAPFSQFEFMPYADLSRVATTGDYNDLNSLPNLALKEDVSNKSQTIDASSTTEYPSSKAAADFVNSSIADNKTTTVRQNGQADNSKCPTEAAVRTAIDSAVSSAYHAAGSKSVAQLTSSLLVSANEGDVYNITDSGVTTSDFIEGAGYPIRIGDNVVVCNVGEGVYKFDLLSGFVDLTNYLTKTGDGSDATASFTAASTRTNVTTGEKLSILFGKVEKWLSDLKALAFKDKVDTADLENDAVTADKVKDNETLPVNISGYASHLRQARCRFSNTEAGYRLMAYLPPKSGYSDTLYAFNIYESRDAGSESSGILKGVLSIHLRNNEGSYQYSSAYKGFSVSNIGFNLRVDSSTHGVFVYATKSNQYYTNAVFELLNAFDGYGSDIQDVILYADSALQGSVTGDTVTPTFTLLKQSGGTIPLANNSGVGSATEPVYVSSTGEVLQCTPSSMSVGSASLATVADTGVKLPTAYGGFDIQTGYRLLATMTAPGAWNDRICTFNVFETRAGMSEPYGQIGTLTVQIRNNNGTFGYGATYSGVDIHNLELVVRSNSDNSVSIYAYSSGSIYGGIQLAMASSSGYTGNPTSREGLTLYLNSSLQSTVTGNAVAIYKTVLWDYVKSKIVEDTVNVNQVDNNTETSSFTFVNNHVYHLTVHLEGSPLVTPATSSGTGYVVAYIGSSMSQRLYSCKQSVDIQSGVLTTKDIKLPVDWKSENITGSSDNQLHVVVVFNDTLYGFSSASPYQLILQGTDFSGA